MEIPEQLKPYLWYLLFDVIGIAIILTGLLVFDSGEEGSFLGMFQNQYQAILVGLGVAILVVSALVLTIRLVGRNRS